MRADRVFQAVCWLPLGVLLLALRDASHQEGWAGGAIAAAVGPPCVGASAILAAIGIVLWIRARRRGQRVAGLLVATLVAGSVLLWFLGRVAYLDLSRGA